ncbi:acetylajmalan esterase [Beta vulgaris subsp. vulgaris]|uniref:acetylajmalan esterase n=1 Tax=Beta vulgaris subsp. vulgaris TaxID=3555 RepID=UPI002036FFE7|nr:acetylajmalan esterase [Beta vulgaris subsp. vulgaris]
MTDYLKTKELYFQLFLQCVLIGFLCNTTVGGQSKEFGAIYQFGDSVSDTGNIIRIAGPNTASANLPYGQTFGRPTGRSSDGLLMIDYFAMHFHLPLLNPFLANGSDFGHGANFAVAGGTAQDFATLAAQNITYRLANNASLASQLGWFNYHVTSICYSPAECKEKLRKALVIVGIIGGNDYNLALTQGKTLEEVYQLVPNVVNTILHAVEEVIQLGAVNVVVPGSHPRGCMPSYLVRFETNDSSKYDDLRCLKEFNAFSRFHNHKLKRGIKKLKLEYPGVAIAYGDYYSAMTWVLRHAASLGFDEDELYTTCCGTGNNNYNYDPSRPCGSLGVSVCSDPNKRVNWDGRHLTQQAYKYMASWLLTQFLPALQEVDA